MRRAFTLIALVCTGCMIGPSGPPNVALGPRGAIATFYLTDSSAQNAELLHAAKDGYLVFASERVAFIPDTLIRKVSLVQAVHLEWRERDHSTVNLMRTVSRFPYGIADSALSTLLRKTGQSKVDTIVARR